MLINDIHYKYIWASGRDLILTSAAQLHNKAELFIWCLGGEDLEWGRGKCASLYTWSSLLDGLVVVLVISVDTTILHTFLSTPACTACTDMVYSKELECDVTTLRWQSRYCP